MRKFSISGASILCLAMFVGVTALAATRRATLGVYFPGADDSGNLNYGLGADGVVKATYNDRNNTVRIIGRSVVTNNSKRTQLFVGAGFIEQTSITGAAAADRYRITSRGLATYNALLIKSTGF